MINELFGDDRVSFFNYVITDDIDVINVISEKGKTFMEYYYQYPQIANSGWNPVISHIIYRPSSTIYYHKMKRVENSNLFLYVKESNEIAKLIIQQLNPFSCIRVSTGSTTDEDGTPIYNNLIRLIEDFTETSIEELAHGEFHYI